MKADNSPGESRDGLICYSRLGQSVRGHNDWNKESWVQKNGNIRTEN